MSDPFECFEENCRGIVRDAVIRYECVLGNNDTIVVEDLHVVKCDRCGEVLFDQDASARIETEIQNKYPGYFERRKK